MQTIPITNDARQTFTTILENQEVRITAWYQDDGDGWYITLEHVDGRVIIQGARLNCSVPLLQDILVDFVGDIVPVPVAIETSILGRNPWGTTHTLSYLTPTEMVQAGFRV